MHITRLHHAQICIPSGQEQAARAYYVVLLGLTEIPKPESLQHRGGFWLQIADQQLHIGVQDDTDFAALKQHIAFQVDDVSAWQTQLSEAGMMIANSVPIPGYERFETRDPFGNRLEFIKALD